MSNCAIRLHQVGKQFRLSRSSRSNPAAPSAKGHATDFWALRNVDLEVERGEVLGIVGRNGAGKSTLLKLVSRVLQPTEGAIELWGSLGSLLEVGTGFHPDLSGRDNVYLNGAILGMRRESVARRFDEIVEYSGVETFIDTPVKYYSSGMYMRLAFAVAAHLDTDILVVDEVLSVGDAAFQQRCLGTIEGAATAGRTVLFVTHSLSLLENICTKAALLDEGTVRFVGPPSDVIQQYLRVADSTQTAEHGSSFDLRASPRRGIEAMATGRCFTEARMLANDIPTRRIRAGERLTFELDYEWRGALQWPSVSIVISRYPAGRVAFLQTKMQFGQIEEMPASGTVRCTIPRLALAPGTYTISLGISDREQLLDWVEQQVELHVEPADYFGTGHLPTALLGTTLVDALWVPPRGSRYTARE